MGQARVVAVSSNGEYRFSKPNRESITLLAGLGIEGDVHAGVTVKHRSRVARDPSQPNLRQVHLMHAELFDELRAQGYEIAPGDLGENVTTRGIALLDLPVDTELTLGDSAIVRLTGLRNPCHQIDAFRRGLLAAVLDRDAEGGLVRKAGVMGVVLRGGVVHVGDAISLKLPAGRHRRLQRV
ncbi:MAG: MOSC domain-containing protein [Rhizobacter sp.]